MKRTPWRRDRLGMSNDDSLSPPSRPSRGFLFTVKPGLYPQSCLTSVEFAEGADVQTKGNRLQAEEFTVKEHLCWDHYSREYEWACQKPTTYDIFGIVRMTMGERVREPSPFPWVYRHMHDAIAEQNRRYGPYDRKRMGTPSLRDLESFLK